MKNTNKLKLNFRKKLMRLVKIFGSGGGARTPDLVINSHPLCQLSYSGTEKYAQNFKHNILTEEHNESRI